MLAYSVSLTTLLAGAARLTADTKDPSLASTSKGASWMNAPQLRLNLLVWEEISPSL